MFAIKAEVSDPEAETFAFSEQKTMYGGKQIAKGDLIFVFASENEGGQGLVASGIVTLGQGHSQEARDRAANAACKHLRQTYRTREASPGAKRAQNLF